MSEDLLSPELLRRLEQFQLLARRRSRSSFKGERRSRAMGQSVEFVDYRSYAVGDDLRYVDWNVYGRLDRMFLKLYEEERELSVVVLVDASESMTFGEPRKFDLARRLAAAVAYVALCGFDRVRVIPLPRPPKAAAWLGALRSIRGKPSALEMFRNLSHLEAGGAAGLNVALRQVAVETRHAAWVVVLSDFLDPAGYAEGLSALLARGFEVAVIQILAGEELEPGVSGDLKLVDAETGAVEEVTFGRHRMKAYQRTVRRYCEGLRMFCHARGVTWARVRSDDSVEELVMKDLRTAGLWG